MMNKDKFDALSAEHQQALLDAAKESEIWLKPRYEQWVNERVGQAVMQGGGAAVSLSDDKREELIAEVQPKWDEEVNKACGQELADKIRALYSEHK